MTPPRRRDTCGGHPGLHYPLPRRSQPCAPAAPVLTGGRENSSSRPAHRNAAIFLSLSHRLKATRVMYDRSLHCQSGPCFSYAAHPAGYDLALARHRSSTPPALPRGAPPPRAQPGPGAAASGPRRPCRRGLGSGASPCCSVKRRTLSAIDATIGTVSPPTRRARTKKNGETGVTFGARARGVNV